MTSRSDRIQELGAELADLLRQEREDREGKPPPPPPPNAEKALRSMLRPSSLSDRRSRRLFHSPDPDHDRRTREREQEERKREDELAKLRLVADAKDLEREQEGK